jgi:hypothetical protein
LEKIENILKVLRGLGDNYYKFSKNTLIPESMRNAYRERWLEMMNVIDIIEKPGRLESVAEAHKIKLV